MIYSSYNNLFKFGSKADTLKQFDQLSLSCVIPPFIILSVSDWIKDKDLLIDKTSLLFCKNPVAVRSSAACEDGLVSSNAGAFISVLNVDASKRDELNEAVERVIASYPDNNGENQVFVQEMVQDIAVSGVILTRFVDDGSPYYVLSYDDESGRSDSVTGGTGIHKTVMVYRKYKPEYCDSPRVQKMLSLAKEVEGICGPIPLDIEFAIDRNGVVYLLQTRRISTVGGWHPDTEHRVSRVIPFLESFVEHLSARRKGLYGDYTVLGNMPDWNPAELIGPVPSPLAVSLFRKLITSSAWSVAREQMGYRSLPRTDLMVMVGGRPYIDVRASFNSFIADGIPDAVGEKLVNAWLERLVHNPSLHDKIEFEVAQTIMDFDFEKNYTERYGNLLNSAEKEVFLEKYKVLSNKALDLSENGSMARAFDCINTLTAKQDENALSFDSESPVALAGYISDLLDACINLGTIPFSIIARHGFIAESFLRSAVNRGAITQERVAAFKASFHTVMGELASDTVAVCNGELDEKQFHEKYGHLRPGTFDIMSPCYKDRPDLFKNCDLDKAGKEVEPFEPTESELQSFNRLLSETGINTIDAAGLLEYARRAIQGRENTKFIFTRHLSAAIEAIATWGEFFNLGREELSFVSIEDIINTSFASSRNEMTSALMSKIDYARIEHSFTRLIKLSYLIRGVKDVHIVPVYRSEPNFITQKRIEKQRLFLKASALSYGSLHDKIVCIENADPGFDWIFTKGIAGLITKYGGANSHMAIRCSELQLPAAIGCGEEMFERLNNSTKIELDCAGKVIRSLDGSYE